MYDLLRIDQDTVLLYINNWDGDISTLNFTMGPSAIRLHVTKEDNILSLFTEFLYVPINFSYLNVAVAYKDAQHKTQGIRYKADNVHKIVGRRYFCTYYDGIRLFIKAKTCMN